MMKMILEGIQAFTIFYMGINIGGAAAPLLCAWLADLYGWHYGFMLAGIGMLAGLLFFNLGQRRNVFGENGKVPNKTTFYTKKFGLNQGHWITIFSFLFRSNFCSFSEVL